MSSWRTVFIGFGVLAFVALAALAGFAPYVQPFNWMRDLVCSDDYSASLNEFCSYNPPSEEEFDLPPGWTIAWTELDCGSGGCPTRLLLLRPPEEVEARTAVQELRIWLRDEGWADGAGTGLSRDDLDASLDQGGLPIVPPPDVAVPPNVVQVAISYKDNGYPYP